MVFAFSSIVPVAAGFVKENEVRDFAADNDAELFPPLLHPLKMTVINNNNNAGSQIFECAFILFRSLFANRQHRKNLNFL